MRPQPLDLASTSRSLIAAARTFPRYKLGGGAMKLVSRLTIALVIGMCLVLATYGSIGVRRERVLFESDMQRDEKLLAHVLSSSVAAVWRRDGPQRALQLVREADAERDDIQIRFVWVRPPSPTGEPPPYGALEAIRKGVDIATIDRSPGSPGRLYTYSPTQIDATQVGAIEVSETLAEENSYVHASMLNTALTILALVAVSGIIAMGLGAWFVGRPVRALMDKARRIGEGDLSGPLALTQHDELAELAQEVNVMCDRLGEARSSLAAETTARISALEQLRHADRLTTVGKLASGIAHELGTPLNVVSGRAKMITRGAPPEQAIASAQIIVEQVDRMTNIIRQLLEFARRRGPQKLPGDVADVARETLSLLEPLAQKAHTELALQGEQSARALFDAGQMQQVLTNLVINGIQAMQKGGRLTVAVQRTHASPPADSADRSGEYVAVSVRDEGSGIEPSHLPHVFEPFFTTKDIGEGTGLGLSVAYGIVREHGGWIEVNSMKDHGSTFTVYLPASAS